ncbi:LysR family transcriptional regulator [Croceicoccus mobilis]|uniref:LysR family transcriptional regulator n=1 Tax=Croceicoccus mobilis TaxID=1703339 RepID=A0A916Z6B2_9SPHN|nr:LysR family transcriptional regulator [Croceicoccus mobilis]GGD78622.1 LysR family transcriptional regulator [Croceicoccus mobilis]
MRLPVDPNLIQLLAVLLRECSVSAAADALGISQPSASRGLARLRDALDDQLLVRSGGGMVRTRRGDELVERLGEWMALTSTLLASDDFNPGELQRRFRIATTDFGAMAVIKPALVDLIAQAPGIAIDILPFTRNSQRMLASGDLDLVISGLPHDGTQLHSAQLFLDRFACVVPPGHALAEESDRPLTLDEFLSCKHLSLTVTDSEIDRIIDLLGNRRAERKVALSTPYFALAPMFAREGNLLFTVPLRAATTFCADGSLVSRTAPVELGELDYRLLWHERSDRDPASQWLRDRLAAACV